MSAVEILCLSLSLSLSLIIKMLKALESKKEKKLQN